MTNSGKHLWLLSDGKAGHIQQLRALSRAMGASAHEVTWQPPGLIATLAKHTGITFGDFPTGLIPNTLPDGILSIGKAGIVAQALLRKHLVGNPYRAHLMSAGRLKHHIDLEIIMHHDNPTAAEQRMICTVPPSPLALHDDTPLPTLPDLGSGMHISLLLGGGNRAFNFTPEHGKYLGKKLQKMLQKQNNKLYITPSRRTPKESLDALIAALGESRYYCWDQTGENPYRAMIAQADSILVTEDSISMQSDVAHAGKPLYIVQLPSPILAKALSSTQKFRRYSQSLIDLGAARMFDGICAPYHTEPCGETQLLAQAIFPHLPSCSQPLEMQN